MPFLPHDLPEWLVPDGQDAIPIAAARFRATGHIAILAAMPAGVETARRRRRDIARALIGAVTGRVPPLSCIETGTHGAPAVLPASLGLHASFSARDGLALIGLARARIGVDIETEPDLRAIPWNILRPDEQTDIRALTPDRQAEAFARLWVLKEAFLKAAGTGLLAPPEAIDLARGVEGGDFVSGPDPAQGGRRVSVPAWTTILPRNSGHARHVALILLS